MASMSTRQALQLARAHFDAGRWAEAESICRAVLEHAADEPEALRLSGLAAYYRGDFAAAESPLRRLIAIEPEQFAHHNNLSAILWQQRRSAEAEGEARRALAIQPGDPGVLNNLGNALQGQQQFEAAAAVYRQVIAAEPGNAEAHNNLGTVLQTLHRWPEALAAHQRAIALRPGYLDAMTNAGAALNMLGRIEEAEAALREVLRIAPAYAPAYQNLSSVWLRVRRWTDAEAACRQALAVRPRYARALLNLATALGGQYRYAEAEEAARQSLAADPDSAPAHSKLGQLLLAQGWVEEGVGLYHEAVAMDPDDPVIHSTAVMGEHYLPDVTPARLAEVHALWQQRHAAPLQSAWPGPEADDADPGRPLRLGFLSEDLGCHPVGIFLVGAVENLDRRECRVVCYNDRVRNDAMTARIRAASNLWREVHGVLDEELAGRIRDDRIDILFDLCGHTSQRLLVFARKPAPLQMTWIGYVGTTGLAAMDYLIADRYQVPAGTEQHYREQILRLPDGYVCFDPPREAPPVGPLPAENRGQLTFGCFNNPVKINRAVVALWAEVLRRVDGARLLLKFGGLGDPSARRRMAELFAAHGIAAERVELSGMSPRAELLAQYNRVDIALDTFPYSGGLTTCEALWMGVPVITCPGETFASRHALSHLSNVGLTETIAGDHAEYVRLAVGLAGDRSRLAALRGGLRGQMAASPLCDAPRFARNLMAHLRDAWQRRLSAAAGGPRPETVPR
jgi:predicted O-linked N-acetylglucosamine transferase (SPINDLY family)